MPNLFPIPFPSANHSALNAGSFMLQLGSTRTFMGVIRPRRLTGLPDGSMRKGVTGVSTTRFYRNGISDDLCWNVAAKSSLCASISTSDYNFPRKMMAKAKEKIFEIACPDCGAMLKVDASTGLVVSHTPTPRKRMFEDLETAAQAMREQDERKESIFRQSFEAEKNKEDLFEKKFAEALRKAKDAPEGKPLREFDLD
jgi:hypothetical protein